MLITLCLFDMKVEVGFLSGFGVGGCWVPVFIDRILSELELPGNRARLIVVCSCLLALLVLVFLCNC